MLPCCSSKFYAVNFVLSSLDVPEDKCAAMFDVHLKKNKPKHFKDFLSDLQSLAFELLVCLQNLVALNKLVELEGLELTVLRH